MNDRGQRTVRSTELCVGSLHPHQSESRMSTSLSSGSEVRERVQGGGPSYCGLKIGSGSDIVG